MRSPAASAAMSSAAAASLHVGRTAPLDVIAGGLEGAVGAIMLAVIGVHGQGGRELR